MFDENSIMFLGIVEEINDPKKLGRVKVRLINEYSNRVETDDIPWATPLMPITSGSILGIGESPIGLQIGSRVVGFFLDGKDKTKPMILGSYPIIQNGNETEHSVSTQARGEGAVQKEYLEYEPKTQYKSEYPYNKTITTKRGHVIEIDDTPKAERIHIYHRKGSYVELNPDGSIIVKALGKSIDISIEDKTIISDKGDIGITANDGNINLEAEKSINIIAKEDSGFVSDKKVTIASGEDLELGSEKNVVIDGIKIKITGDVEIEGSLKVNGITK